MSYPIIEVLKPHNEQLYDRHLLRLPADTPFGNISLKYLDIVQRSDFINDKIIKIYEYNKFLNDNGGKLTIDKATINTKVFPIYKALIEELFFWFRKTADEFISILFYLKEVKTIGSYPLKVKIDCIGGLLANKDKQSCYDDSQIHFLQILNDISNAYKHSFLNAQLSNILGSEFPVVYAAEHRLNDLYKHKPKYYSLDLKEVIDAYSDFLRVSKDELLSFATNEKTQFP